MQESDFSLHHLVSLLATFRFSCFHHRTLKRPGLSSVAPSCFSFFVAELRLYEARAENQPQKNDVVPPQPKVQKK